MMTTPSLVKLKLGIGWLLLAVCLLPYQNVAGSDSSFNLDITAIVEAHNFIRRTTIPSGADINQLIWNYGIANLAWEVAEKCQFGIVNTTELAANIVDYDTSALASNINLTNIGVNMGVRSETIFKGNLEEFISEWSSERQFYNYYKSTCNSLCTCTRYLQLVWGSVRYVGCGVSNCSKVDGFWTAQETTNAVLFVCIYGPGGAILGTQPYTEGKRCSRCPPEGRTCIDNLCAPTEEGQLMGDPHFTVRLPGGHFLCFSIQGDDGKIYNLFTTDLVKVHAKFVLAHHRDTTNTWIGSIGIYALGQSFTFDMLEEKIVIGEQSLYAYNISSVSMMDGHFQIRQKEMQLGEHQTHNVEVELQDVSMKFIVSFVSHHHLNLYWNINKDDHQEANEGIIGQYYRPGIEIDEVNGILHLPGQPSTPVKPAKHGYGAGHCWTTRKYTDHEQIPGFLDKQIHDYEVYSLIANEFKSNLKS